MDRKDTNQLLKPAKIGAILLGAAVIIGVLVMLLSAPRSVKVEPAPEFTATPVVSAAPTPTPAPELTPTPDDCGWVSDASYVQGGYCSYHPEWYSDADRVQTETYTEQSGGGTSNFQTYDDPYAGSAPYIGNANSRKFHYSWCSSVSDMKPSTRVEFYSRDDAVNSGYVPCKRCNP